MLIYEIPYDEDKTPNAFSDSLSFIDTNDDEYCFFKAKPNHIHLVCSEKFINYFSPLLEVYEAKKLDKLPPLPFTILGGNSILLINP